MNQLSIPGSVYWTTHQKFTEEMLVQLAGKNVLIFMNDSNAKRSSLGEWINKLKKKANLYWINQIPSNPTYIDILNTLNVCNNETPDIVIAIGGGSVIDMAKSCVALWYMKNHIEFDDGMILNSIKTKGYLNHSLDIPIYAVPTTAGTSSEVTRWATVWDVGGQTKYSIEAENLCPERAYIIPEYTIYMPKRLTLATGLDALSHAVEAYWAKSSNPMVKELSKISIRLIIEYLPKVLEEGNNLYKREKMCMGSLFAGLAFANTRTTACHSLSYPLTMCFGIEHGLACAISLPKVMQLNLSMIEDVEELLKALNVIDPEGFQIWLDHVSRDIVELRLSTFGITEKDIASLVELSFTQGRMDNNPCLLSKEQVNDLLHELI